MQRLSTIVIAGLIGLILLGNNFHAHPSQISKKGGYSRRASTTPVSTMALSAAR